MTVKKGQELEVVISDVVYGGQGIAKVDGYTLFIDQAAPLDVALVRIFKKKKNYAFARIAELRQPSPHRVQPPCLYSGFCGGCKWQFLKYEQQLVSKQQQVIDALERIGKCMDVCVNPTIPSEDVFGYRNKMEFSCSTRRWLLPEEMGVEGIDAMRVYF